LQLHLFLVRTLQQSSAVLFSDSPTAPRSSPFTLCACCSGFYFAGRSVHVLDPGQSVCCGNSYILRSNIIRRWLAMPTVDEVRQLKPLSRPLPEAIWPSPLEQFLPAPTDAVYSVSSSHQFTHHAKEVAPHSSSAFHGVKPLDVSVFPSVVGHRGTPCHRGTTKSSTGACTLLMAIHLSSSAASIAVN
jgi:hypothetical protein